MQSCVGIFLDINLYIIAINNTLRIIRYHRLRMPWPVQKIIYNKNKKNKMNKSIVMLSLLFISGAASAHAVNKTHAVINAPTTCNINDSASDCFISSLDERHYNNRLHDSITHVSKRDYSYHQLKSMRLNSYDKSSERFLSTVRVEKLRTGYDLISDAEFERRELLSNIQTGLNLINKDQIAVDGIQGDETTLAIVHFQESTPMVRDGYPSKEMLDQILLRLK